jgi:hypothetical protein
MGPARDWNAGTIDMETPHEEPDRLNAKRTINNTRDNIMARFITNLLFFN